MKKAIATLCCSVILFAGAGTPKTYNLNCESLKPKTNITSEEESKIAVQLGGKLKTVLGVNGRYEDSKKIKKIDLIPVVPNADKVEIAKFAAYYLCMESKEIGVSGAKYFVTKVLPTLGYGAKEISTRKPRKLKTETVRFDYDKEIMFNDYRVLINAKALDGYSTQTGKKVIFMYSNINIEQYDNDGNYIKNTEVSLKEGESRRLVIDGKPVMLKLQTAYASGESDISFKLN